MKKALIAVGALLLIAAGTLFALFQVWTPDEAALRASGWSSDATAALAESVAKARPMLVKFGLHG